MSGDSREVTSGEKLRSNSTLSMDSLPSNVDSVNGESSDQLDEELKKQQQQQRDMNSTLRAALRQNLNQTTRKSALVNPTCQKDLLTKLKRIRLSKQQYETSHSYEERKLITRMALKIARSSSNLDDIYSRQKAEKQPSTPTLAVLRSSLKKEPTIIAEAATNETEPVENPTVVSTSPSNMNDSNLSSSTSSTNSPRLKKTVTWHWDVKDKSHGRSSSIKPSSTPTPATKSLLFNQPTKIRSIYPSGGSSSAQHQRITRTSLYDLNKKYAELKLKFPNTKPIFMLPKLVHNGPNETNHTSSSSSNNRLKLKTKNTESSEKKYVEIREKFYSNILNEQEANKSGCFFSYKDSHGRPLCLGYDNFVQLVNFNASSLESDDWDSSSQHKDLLSDVTSFERLLTRRERAMSNSRRARTASSAYSINSDANNSPNQVFCKAKLAYERENERKYVEDMFKAQKNAKSLTFKNVSLY